MSYWLSVFSIDTWREFKENGSNVAGFNARSWPTLQRIKFDDYLICYLAKTCAFIAIAKVVSKPYESYKPIWRNDTYPCRIDVEIIKELHVKDSVHIKKLVGKLSFLKESNAIGWAGHVRRSPCLWKDEDGQVVTAAIFDASGALS